MPAELFPGAHSPHPESREGKRGRDALAPAPCPIHAPAGGVYLGANAPTFSLIRALWNSRFSRATNFTSIPFGHAAWHS